MHTVRETENYALLYDNFMGVARFRRKSDNELSLMETGTEAQHIVETVMSTSDASFNKDAEFFFDD